VSPARLCRCKALIELDLTTRDHAQNYSGACFFAWQAHVGASKERRMQDEQQMSIGEMRHTVLKVQVSDPPRARPYM
jgi:hypothetical protein